jgi:hypothetical protein
MKRREVITLLGGAAVASPLAARAQQAAMPAVGFLDVRSPEAMADRLSGFRQGLREAGYVEGESATVVYRRMPRLRLARVGRSPLKTVRTTSRWWAATEDFSDIMSFADFRDSPQPIPAPCQSPSPH